MANFNKLSQSDKIYYANQFINQDYNGFFDLYDIDPKKVRKSGLELAEYLQKNEPKIFRSIVEEALEQEEGVLLGCKTKKRKKTTLSGSKVLNVENFGFEKIEQEVYQYMIRVHNKLTHEQVRNAMYSFISIILEQIGKGKNVQIPDLGSFRLVKRKYKTPNGSGVTHKVKFTVSQSKLAKKRIKK